MRYLAKEILRHASSTPEDIAVVDREGARKTTWKELYTLACQIAAQAKAEELSGVVPIVQGRTMEYIATFLGLNMAGCGAAPLVDSYPQARIDYIISDLGAKGVADEAFVARAKGRSAEPFASQILGSDITLVTYTSGSTGNPKGVMFGSDALFAAMDRTAGAVEYDRQTIAAQCAPMSFIAVFHDLYPVLLYGGCIHLLTDSVRKDAVALCDYIDKHGITHSFISPQMLRQINRKLPSIKAILTGSERLSGVTPELNRVVNSYGLSETAGPVTFYPLDSLYDNTPIGKPTGDMMLYLVDENGKLSDEGEICISGTLSKGYWNLPEETAKAFTCNPFSDAPEYRVLLHTGDLGKRLEDGNILFVNRKDWMVKINGQRVEPGEIEAQLKKISGVTQAVVKGFENSYGQTYLCAWYTCDRAVTEQEIRQALSKQLASYMIPTFILKLDSFPVNANGKLNRRALEAPDASLFQQEYEAPVNALEVAICRGFEKVLGVSKVGRNDDFFALGGDSIQAVRLCAQLEASIASAEIFAGRTPCEIAKRAEAKKARKISFEAEGDTFPLTAGQAGVYFACMSAPESLMYNIPVACPLPAGTDIERLTLAIKLVLEKYAAFGVRFESLNGEIRMIPQAPVEDITITQTDDIKRYKAHFLRPFDLQKGNLARFEIVKTSDHIWLLMDMHHIISDGTSVGLCLRAIADAYEGRTVPGEPISLFAAACAEKALEQTEEYAIAQAFFAEKLSGEEFDGYLLPDDTANESIIFGDAATFETRFDDATQAVGLELFTKKYGLTEATVFLGAYAFAMSKALGGEGCRFCTVNNGRHYPELNQTVGMLVRTLPMMVRLNEEESSTAYLSRIQELFFATMANDSYPFSKLAQEYGISNESMFVYQAESLNCFDFDGQEVPVQVMNNPCALSMLAVHIFKANGGYRASVQYRKDLYTEQTIQMFVKLMKLAIRGFISDIKLRDIPLVDAEAIQKLESFHGQGSDEPRISVLDLLRGPCSQMPDRIAVISGETKITYGQLEEMTDRLAAHLVKQGIGRGDVVAVLSDRNEMMVICPIAISKTGAMYQPLDSTYPPDRLTFMVQDSNAKLLISPKELRHLVETDISTCYAEEIAGLPACDLPLPVPEADDAFVILYTSGSTGLPKGCILEHGNLVAYLRYYIKRYDMSAASRTIAYASFGFDANMMDMYTPLCVGAQLHIIPEDMRLDFSRLNTYMEDNGITHAFFTTQVGRQFATTMHNKSLKYLLTGGEALTPCEPPEDYTLVNLYGPTECAIAVTAFDVDKLYASVPIGYANTEVGLYILDKYLRRVPVGVPGELCVSGPQVSRGYLNRPEKTAEVFINNPFTCNPQHTRMYRTGDVVRFLPDGNVQFIGRRDSQVKIRGFRIELSEVERVIREYDGISDATVIAKDAPSGGKMLWAYIVSDQAVDIDALNRFILERKPPYMVPAATMQIDKIPLNQNMKVNKRLLPEIKMSKPGNESRALTKLEKDIIEIVAGLTGSSEIPVSSPLTLFGISSISAIQLAAKLEERFGVLVDVKLLLSDSSVLDIENEIIQMLLNSNRKAEQPLPVMEPMQTSYPLTQTQLGIYLECLKAGKDSDVYNIPVLWKFDSSMDAERLCDAVEKAVCSHPVLFCSIVQDADGTVFMRPCPDPAYQVPVVETSKDCLMQTVRSLRTFFDLNKGPLFTATVIKTKVCCYLLFEAHHIVADGTSLSVLLEDIDSAYTGVKIPEERISQYDIADTEARARQTDALEDAKAYYQTLLSGVESSPVPVGDLTEDGVKGAVYEKHLPLSQNAVASYAKNQNVTENAFFTTAFAFTLSKYTARNDALFTTIFHGRTDLRMSRTVGMLVKTLPVCAKFDGSVSIASSVSDMKEQLMHSMSADLYSFAEISREFEISSDVMFVYQGDILHTQTVGGQDVESIALSLEGLKSAFSVELHQKNGEYLFQIEYDACRYSQTYVSLFADAFCKAAEQMLVCKTFADMSILSESGVDILMRMNDTAANVPSMPAYRLMESSADRYPERIACIARGERVTYAQLNTAANHVAHSLIAEGVKVNHIVGLLLERTKYVYMAREGILKAGGAFLSLDPEYPDDRITFILGNAGCKILLTTRDIFQKRREMLSAAGVRILFMEDLVSSGRDENPAIPVPDDALAYCIYTSGSTGTPKGVLLSQRNLINFATVNDKNLEARYYTEGNRVSLALASISFDVSIMEEFLPFACGMTVCMATEEEIHDAGKFFALLNANKVDAICCTPSFLANFIDMPGAEDALTRIQAYDLGAEAYLPALTEKIHGMNPAARIINGYGPTEATISCTCTLIHAGERITIGKPNANVEAYVLDQQGHILPPCAIGELALTGAGVGIGYLGLPERTEKSFVMLDTPKGIQRAYRSGDSVMLLPDGNIVFFGRLDDQVKLRGLRIELGEVQSVLSAYPGIKNCIVLVVGEGMSAYLAAWYTAEHEIDKAALMEYMGTKLTKYMVPTALMQLDAIPMTSNRKVDKKRLPKPEQQKPATVQEKPRSKAEADYCRIMAEVLGLHAYGATDDFFEMGGTSLTASRVLMQANMLGYSITYSDIFSDPTPRALAAMEQEHSSVGTEQTDIDDEIVNYDYTAIHDLLRENTIEALKTGEYRELKNVCITGAAGFLGIHILKEFLDTCDGKAYCILRGKGKMKAEDRLRSMLVYYFSDGMDALFDERIITVDGDITDPKLYEQLMQYPIDTYINCAANVKHFSAGTDIEDINIGGVELGTDFALRKGCRFVQISTVSVAGMSVDHVPDDRIRFNEHMLYFGQNLSNKYIRSKFLAERIVLEKSLQGLDGKIIRVGNLMARYTDGEFQANFLTNNFLKSLKAFSIIGCIPFDLLDADCEFAPIDSTATAVLTLARLPKECRVFHAYNNHVVHMGDVLAELRTCGVEIRPCEHEEYDKAYANAMEQAENAASLNALTAYRERGRETIMIDSENSHTSQVLYRQHYIWPLVSSRYLKDFFTMMIELGYFDQQ